MSNRPNDHDIDHPLTTAYEKVHNAAGDMAALDQIEELKVKKDNDMLRHIKNMRRFWHQG